jgi:hypothetical protein
MEYYENTQPIIQINFADFNTGEDLDISEATDITVTLVKEDGTLTVIEMEDITILTDSKIQCQPTLIKAYSYKDIETIKIIPKVTFSSGYNGYVSEGLILRVKRLEARYD